MKNYFKQVYYGFIKTATEIEFIGSIGSMMLGMPIWLFFACIFWYIGDII